MLGRVDYAISIVAYFILFSTLGIPNYGIRTISGVRDDGDMSNNTTEEKKQIVRKVDVLKDND